MKVVGKLCIFFVFLFFLYQRVFRVPLGGDDGYSSVVLHAAALNHKVAGMSRGSREGGYPPSAAALAMRGGTPPRAET